ncbi:MAG: alpha/beta fold hydrolase [Elusimicrobia bacterium]|nr:alpha/beta fold hydrolase [Elusimicrobiota bacterium]
MEGAVNGIAFEDSGPRGGGAPVVFIHGFPFDRTMWEPQLREVSKDRRVIAYDVRGHGRSQAGDGQYSIELFVDDLVMLLDHSKVERAVLCGLSMGGYIALRAAERQPERLSGLVLCDTKSGPDTDEARIKRAATIAAVKKYGVPKFANEFIKAVLTEETLRTKPAITGALLNSILANSPLGISGTLLALAARTDTTAALAKISVPTLILVGEQDKITPPAASEAMLKALPEAALHVIPDAAHMSNLENPAVFNERLLAFLIREKAAGAF